MKFAAVGSNCIDYYENLNGGTAFPGGGPVNMAVYAARLGAQSAYVGPVGSDPFRGPAAQSGGGKRGGCVPPASEAGQGPPSPRCCWRTV